MGVWLSVGRREGNLILKEALFSVGPMAHEWGLFCGDEGAGDND